MSGSGNKFKDRVLSLPICTRVEVIDQNGRSYVNYKDTNSVSLSWQDKGKTLKIFIEDSIKQGETS